MVVVIAKKYCNGRESQVQNPDNFVGNSAERKLDNREQLERSSGLGFRRSGHFL
jgi:hypothetical protein